MGPVSSAFISSRRERIIFSVLSASGCACKAAVSVDVLRVLDEADFAEPDLGKTDLDNTDVARNHSFHCIAEAESGTRPLYYACGVNGFKIPVTLFLTSSSCRPGSEARSMPDAIPAGSENPRRARDGPPAWRPDSRGYDNAQAPALRAQTTRENFAADGR